jgi:integrase
MAKITFRFLASLTPTNGGETIREEGNLYGRVRSKNDGSVTVAFYYRFRFGNKLKDFSCGTWPGDSLAQIRSNRDAARVQVSEGVNPCTQKKLVQIERQEVVEASLTEKARKQAENLVVADLFDAWLRDGVRRADGNAELIRSFNADLLPAIGTRPIRDLTEHDIRGVLRAFVARGTNRAAVVMRNNLTQMFAWARKRQPWRKLLVEGDPMDLIEIEKIVSPEYDLENQRDRILSSDEIRELHCIFRQMHERYDSAVDKRSTTQPIEATTECAIWIMLSTMCRVGELSMARWEHVNLDIAEWLIPKENTKGKQSSLIVFLSAFALAQFRALHELSGRSEWCFPARNNPGHVDVKSISKQVGDRQARFKKSRDGTPRKPMANRCHENTLVLAGGARGAWTPHDLRRTGATLMQSLGVSLEVIDRCQNHVLPGSKVRRHYLHHDYANEKRQAWKILGDHLSLNIRDVLE